MSLIDLNLNQVLLLVSSDGFGLLGIERVPCIFGISTMGNAFDCLQIIVRTLVRANSPTNAYVRVDGLGCSKWHRTTTRF